MAGRVTLAGGTTFRRINTLARLTGTTLGRKRDICTFDYLIRVKNNHAGSTLTRSTGTTFSHILGFHVTQSYSKLNITFPSQVLVSSDKRP